MLISQDHKPVKKFLLFFLSPLAKFTLGELKEGPVSVFTWVNRKKGRKQ
jgi:hypothetical protein